jgi:hypothetical protein
MSFVSHGHGEGAKYISLFEKEGLGEICLFSYVSRVLG